MFPRWTRSPVSRLVRRLTLSAGLLPATGYFMKLTVEGREHLEHLTTPVLFAANHQSHMDTPAIYHALPPRLRHAVAPAMAKEFFAPHFGLTPASLPVRLASTASFYFACQCFNAFPLPQRESPRAAFRYMRELNADGYSILIYPEGLRSDSDRILPFKRGVGMLAIHLNLPVVPIRLEGLDKVLHKNARWAKRGPARVAFGIPLYPNGDDAGAFTARIEAAVRAL